MDQGKPSLVADSPPVDLNAICQKVRAAVEPARAYAVSLHDATGDVLWLSESSMGPDEHNAVIEGIEAFSNSSAPPMLAYDLGDSRSAVLLRAVNSRRAMVGVIMIVMDTRAIKQDSVGVARLMNPKLQRALSEFAAMRPDADAAPALTLAVAAPLPGTPASSATARQPRLAQVITPEVERFHAALRRSPIALYVQCLVPLTKGSELKRYEVLLRSKSENAPNAAPHAMLKAAVENGLGSMIDRRVVTELIGWLVHHPQVWRTNAVMFSVNLTTTALHDEHFIKFVELCLAKSSLPKGIIAFEIDVATAIRLGDKAVEIATALERLGCPLVLDDFGLRTECIDLLRLPAVRYIKLAPEVTAKMRSDKIAQAAITGVVQMARVLGMHTVAKRTEGAAEQEWLTALGVDFIQSNALSPPAPIGTLEKTQGAAP